MPPPLTAVLVLYRVPLEQSACFASLTAILAERAPNDDFRLLVYDNSPDPQIAAAFPATLMYQHDPENGGVAAGYSEGLSEARRNRSAWLLLLDQDTTITTAYLDELISAMSAVPDHIAAIVPRLIEGGKTHSPQTLPRLSHHPLPDTVTGALPSGNVTAYNSGAALRVSALQQFPKRYWLDFLDHAVFHEIQASGGQVWLLHARLQHSLSTERLGEDASPARYLNVLQAERDFYREYGTLSDFLFYRLRRAKQTVGHFLKVRDKHFAMLSARAALGLLPRTPPRSPTRT